MDTSKSLKIKKIAKYKLYQKDATIVHFTRPKPWYGEYNTNKAGDENFDKWLNNFNSYGIKNKLNITETLLNSQKEAIVEKYHEEWKKVAADVVKSVYE